jgi:hypothetical protein
MRPFKIVPGDNATLVTVEKDCVLYKIAKLPVMDTYGLILATGKGFPPLALKSAVSQIQAMLKEPKKPVIHFGDCNPEGISIMNSFTWTDKKWGPDSGTVHCTPLVWGGLRPTQLTFTREWNARKGGRSVKSMPLKKKM